MKNVTLSIPEPLKQNMEQLPEINWSELMREFLSEKVRKLLILKKLEKDFENSKLTDKDCIRLGRKLRADISKHK